MVQALRAALALDDHTKRLMISFKACKDLQIPTSIHGFEVAVNEWVLNQKMGHKKYGCLQGSLSSHLFCHCVASCVFGIVLKEGWRLAQYKGREASLSEYPPYEEATRTISQIPFGIEAKPGASPGGIDVSWKESLSLLVRKPRWQVTLHREKTCSKVRDQLSTSSK